jgi:hypothetical protein
MSRKPTARQLADYVRATLAPFYRDGAINHAALLAEMEARNGGKPLSDSDQRGLARVVAAYERDRAKGARS